MFQKRRMRKLLSGIGYWIHTINLNLMRKQINIHWDNRFGIMYLDKTIVRTFANCVTSTYIVHLKSCLFNTIPKFTLNSRWKSNLDSAKITLLYYCNAFVFQARLFLLWCLLLIIPRFIVFRWTYTYTFERYGKTIVFHWSYLRFVCGCCFFFIYI